MFVCKRCLVEFKQKSNLINHLNRKNICMAIESDILPSELIKELNDKGEDKVECSKCNNIYKNKNSLRMHKCKAVNSINDLDTLKKELEEKFEARLEIVKNELRKELENKPTNITNNTDNSKHITNNINNNNVNVTLNCLMDCSGKSIGYLLKREDIIKKVLGWIRSKDGFLDYINEKFNNPEHPENQIIKKGKNDGVIKIYVRGKWTEYENFKAGDLILTNVGNDFMTLIEFVKDDEDEYKNNRKVLKKFEEDIMRPLEWGIEISEDGEKLVTKTLIKNEKGEILYLEDEKDNDKKIELINRTIKHVYKMFEENK